jgi:hypothetical protein
MGGMKELWMQRQGQSPTAAAYDDPEYPYKAGWKDPGISRENAERIDKSGTLNGNMKAALALFEAGFQGTADEVAERLEKSPFAIRPACTHLRKINKIERTPERRTGAGGGTAAVLKIKEQTNAR